MTDIVNWIKNSKSMNISTKKEETFIAKKSSEKVLKLPKKKPIKNPLEIPNQRQ